MKKYSSSFTGFHKFFSVIGIPIFLLIILFIEYLKTDKSFYLILFSHLPFLMLLTGLVIHGFRLKHVFVENDYVIISDSFKSIKLPLSKIKEVYEWSFIFKPQTAAIKFEEKTAFGSGIIYLPKTKLFDFFKTHSDIVRLRMAVEKAKKEKFELDSTKSLPIAKQADALYAKALIKQKNGEVALALRYFDKTLKAVEDIKVHQVRTQEIIAESHLGRASIINNNQFPNKYLIANLEYAYSIFAQLHKPIKQLECISYILRELFVNRMKTGINSFDRIFNSSSDELKIQKLIKEANLIKQNNLNNEQLQLNYDEIIKKYNLEM